MKLHEAYRPRLVVLEGFATELDIAAVDQELKTCADRSPDQCWGYFPGMGDRPGISQDLPACVQFADQNPSVQPAFFHMLLGFNFLRMSRIQQEARSPYHLDSDAATANRQPFAYCRPDSMETFTKLKCGIIT